MTEHVHDSTATPPADERRESFAALSSTSSPDVSDAPQEPVRVIPLDPPDVSGRWVLKVGPSSAVTAAENRLVRRDLAGLTLSPEGRRLLFQSALDPAGVADEKLKRRRVGHGWIHRLEGLRLFTPMVNLSPSNDRLLAEAVYAADPDPKPALRGLPAVPMPTSHPEYAEVVYACDRSTLREAADITLDRVAEHNPVDVGRRIIEEPVTLVAAAYAPTVDTHGRPVRDPEAAAPVELVAVDGNSRLARALRNIVFPFELLPQRLHPLYEIGPTVTLRPSLLNQMTGSERRDLTRRLLKHFSDRYDALQERERLRGTLSTGDRTARNAAAVALNSLTVPATIIVGYVDDDAELGNERFATAVRDVLQGMNVAPKPFDEGARGGVSAEQAVVALHEARLLGPDSATHADADATRDVLIGRNPVASAMGRLGLTPLADLRAAVVVRELTRPGPDVTRELRGPLNTTQVHLKHRAGPVVELLLRGYTASRERRDVEAMRKVLSSGTGGCLWRGLLDTHWEVVDVATDDAVDDLVEQALDQVRHSPTPPQGARCLLGVLGMTALVSGGYLLAAGGSGEYVAGAMEEAGGRVGIHRGSVGSVVGALLDREWGIRLLGDAVKRSRAGATPRLIDATTLQFSELPQEQRTARTNAAIRRMLKTDDEPDVDPPTDADRRRQAFERFSRSVVDAGDVLQDLLELHASSSEKISFTVAEATLAHLQAIEGNFRTITAPRPMGSW